MSLLSRRTRSVATGIFTAGFLAISSAAQAQITFNFDFSANTPGVGFLDVLKGASRRAALVTAGNLFSTMFGTYFTNTATIKIAVTSIEDSGTNTLASAGSALQNDGTGILNEVIKAKLKGGADLNGNDADGGVDVNFGYEWELDPNVAAGTKFDFFAALNHEFTHAIGFASTLGDDGAPLAPGQFSTFDTFLQNAAGTRFINGGTVNQSLFAAALIGGTPPGPGHTAGLFFGGAFAQAAYGKAVGIHSPGTLEPGSSGSHLDTDDPDFFLSMMKTNRDVGFEPRTYSAVEVGILRDLGYTYRTSVSVVPEPSTYMLMFAGLGVIGMIARRRKA